MNELGSNEMFPLLPVSLWHPANTSGSQARGSGFKYHFLQIFILNPVEFYRISLGKTLLAGFKLKLKLIRGWRIVI